jgi:hypothetical protein
VISEEKEFSKDDFPGVKGDFEFHSTGHPLLAFAHAICESGIKIVSSPRICVLSIEIARNLSEETKRRHLCLESVRFGPINRSTQNVPNVCDVAFLRKA